MRRSLRALAALLLAVTGCGDAHPLDQMATGMAELIEDANAWVEAPQLEQRRERCQRERGQWAEVVEIAPCVDGKTQVVVDGEAQEQECGGGTGGLSAGQCVHRDKAGRFYFNDGPSHPFLLQTLSGSLDGSFDLNRWNTLFWPAAVNHDYCYHHNGITRALSQQDCDRQFLSDLSAICAQPRFSGIHWFTKEVCKRHAALMFAAVRSMGDEPYFTMNTRVAYPAWVPVWKQYDMGEDVSDPEMAEAIEQFLNRFKIKI